MSHFASMQTQLVNPDALLKGLQALLAEHQINAIVEVHNPANLLENAYSLPTQEIAIGSKAKICSKVLNICSGFIKILTRSNFSSISEIVILEGK